MAVRLTKKGKILLIILVLIASAGLGGGLWYLNNLQNQVAPDDSAAADCMCNDIVSCGESGVNQDDGCTYDCVDDGNGNGTWGPPYNCPGDDGSGEPDCNSCVGVCGNTGCQVECDGNTNPRTDCGYWPGTAYCRGWSQSGCNEVHGGYLGGTGGSVDIGQSVVLNNINTGQNVTVSTWCSTAQSDSNAPNGAFSVIFIGDGGVSCLDGDPSCNPAAMDWSCCGNGNPEAGEACDDGNSNNDDGCRNDCTVPQCGDGIEDPGEQCDDGNSNDNDSCRNNCTVPSCGDGSINGNEECDPTASNNSCEFGTCRADCTCPGEPSASCGDGELNGGEECDATAPAPGNTCEFGACAVDCSCPGPNPVWDIDKTGSSICTNQSPPSATVTYVVTVTNNGTTAGILERIEDTLDDNVDPGWVNQDSFEPPATLAGRVITWTLSGTDQNFEPGESREFTYSLTVPGTHFGEYTNTVVGYPGDEGEENFEDVFTMVVSCNTPSAALFDSTQSKIVVALFLIVVSFAYLRSDMLDNVAVNMLGYLRYRRNPLNRAKRYRDRFEDGFDGK